MSSRNQRQLTPSFDKKRPQSSLLGKPGNTRSASQSKKNLASKSSSKNNCQRQKFGAQMDSLNSDLTNNMGKLNSCLQIYSILESNMQNQRCLQHNNSLSLYCLNQRRILCVNCLYGLHRHRSHKVVPLKDSMSQVMQDNKKLIGMIEQELKRMTYYAKIAEQNTVVLETEMHRALTLVESEYKSRVSELTKKYEVAKSVLESNFKPIIDSLRDVQKQIENFHFRIWDTFTRFTEQKKSDDWEIMRQLLFVNIVELSEVRCRNITKFELEQLSRRPKLN